jgi:hypothetical protein
MLAVKTYPKAYIDGCRRKVDAQLAAYRKLKRTPELVAFAPLFFNSMVLALDRYFNHRMRGNEGKDGNALNEVRMLCTSLTDGDGTLRADSTIKYDAKKAVLKLDIGDVIAIDVDAFEALAAAFFAEMRKKFA